MSLIRRVYPLIPVQYGGKYRCFRSRTWVTSQYWHNSAKTTGLLTDNFALLSIANIWKLNSGTICEINYTDTPCKANVSQTGHTRQTAISCHELQTSPSLWWCLFGEPEIVRSQDQPEAGFLGSTFILKSIRHLPNVSQRNVYRLKTHNFIY